MVISRPTFAHVVISLVLVVSSASAASPALENKASSPACLKAAVARVSSFRNPHDFRFFNGALLFKISRLVMDLDGAPTTYGVRDQGIDGICNGIAAYTAPPICRSDVNAHGCFAACQAAVRDWNTPKKEGDKPRTESAAKRLFCSVGIGSGCGPSFNFSIQPPEDSESSYFVSSTSLHYKEPVGQQRSVWQRTQDAQLDATKVPYFSLPPQLRLLYGVQLGDVGVMVRTDEPNGQPVFFIMGDGGSGKSVGEVSGNVRQQISALRELPQKKQVNAFGNLVNRVVAPSPPPVAIAIFPGTNKLVPKTRNFVDLNQENINDWIELNGKSGLDSIGGIKPLILCAPDEP